MAHFRLESFETAIRGVPIRPALVRSAKLILRPATWLGSAAADYRRSCELGMLTDAQLKDIGVARQILYVEWRLMERKGVDDLGESCRKHKKTDAADVDFT